MSDFPDAGIDGDDLSADSSLLGDGTPIEDPFAPPASEEVDFDGDGVVDATVEYYDFTGDGVIDTMFTQFTDGSYDVVMDTDGDLEADTYAVDLNGDGAPEMVVTETGDGDYLVSVDSDGDGVLDTDQYVSRADLEAAYPEVASLLDGYFGGGDVPGVDVPADDTTDTPDDTTEDTPDDGADTDWVDDGQLIGDPEGQADGWFEQAANGFCVPGSVAQIVGAYTGQDFSDESAFVDLANELHVFVVGPDGVPGISIDGAYEMLVASGVPCDPPAAGTMDDLAETLSEGGLVLIAVDSGEIWYGEETEDNAADHAVVVTGIDTENGLVYLSDTGSPDGNMEAVPIEVFEDAWADSGNAMIACDVAAGDPAAAAVEGDLTASADSAPAASGPASWVSEHSWVMLPVTLAASTFAPHAA